MPEFSISQALTANQQNVNPLASGFWTWETPPWDYVAKFIGRATTAGVRMTVFNGPINIKQKSIVQSGGTAGVTPSELNTTPQFWEGNGGQRLQLIFDEVLGGTPTVDGTITIEPR